MTEKSTHWYRQPWAVGIFIIFLVDIIFALIFVYRSLDGADDVVVDDYYKDGLGINERIERTKTAASLGITADLEFTQIEDGFFSVALDLNHAEGFEPTDMLLLNLNHPVKEDLDRQVIMRRVADGRYEGESDLLLKHHWYINVEPYRSEVNWRLKGRIDFKFGMTLQLK